MLPVTVENLAGNSSVRLARVDGVSSQRKAWFVYIVLRLLFFIVPFGLLYVLGLSLGFSMMMSGIIAAVLAMLIGVSLSVLLLSKPREQAAESVYEWRNRDRTRDDIEEDAVIDRDSE